MGDFKRQFLGPKTPFGYVIDETNEYALRDISLALNELAIQFDRADIEDVSGGGLAALLRVFARATGYIAISAKPGPVSFQAKRETTE